MICILLFIDPRKTKDKWVKKENKQTPVFSNCKSNKRQGGPDCGGLDGSAAAARPFGGPPHCDHRLGEDVQRPDPGTAEWRRKEPQLNKF